jgi:hypothetical protein
LELLADGASATLNSHWSKHIDLGAKLETDWNASLEAYTKKYPEEAAEFKQLISLELPENWASALPVRFLIFYYEFHCPISIFCLVKHC